MSVTDPSMVFTGFWTDYSYGSVLGATWTTSANSANTIVALVAILVSVGIGSAWSLLLFVIHQIRATSVAKDGLFRQQQVLLRTLGSPGSITVDSIKLAAAHSKRSPHALLRTLGLALASVAFTAGGLAAGVFSSLIVNSNTVEVLLQASGCSTLNMTAYVATSSAANVNIDQLLQNEAETYADNCYTPWASSALCSIYVQPSLNLNMARDESPFPESITFNKTSAVVFDSGYLNSNNDFGINARTEHQVEVRRKATCVPLDSANHVSVIDPAANPSTGSLRRQIPTNMLLAVNYGPVLTGDASLYNATDIRDTLLDNITSQYYPMGVRAYASRELKPFNGVDFISELQKDDADVTLIVIHNGAVSSLVPIEGPIYAAHKPSIWQLDANHNQTVYMADAPLGIIGCAEQYEYCIGGLNGKSQRTCTELAGARNDGFAQLLPSASDQQLATLQLLGAATTYSGLVNSANHGVMNSSSLYGRNDWLPGLPQDQWAYDVATFESVVLSSLQIVTAMQPQGYPLGDGTGDENGTMVVTPADFSDPGLDAICRNQKVLMSSNFANINMFALAFVTVTTLFFVLLDYGVVRILLHLHIVRESLWPRLRFWIEDDVYQLQRAAYMSRNVGSWNTRVMEVPVVEKGTLLGSLNSYHSEKSLVSVCSTPVKGSP